MQKPSIGRTVIVKGFQSNGTDEQPATITRTWDYKPDVNTGSTGLINVMVLPDCGVPTNVTSIELFHTREDAESAMAAGTKRVAFWPDRI